MSKVQGITELLGNLPVPGYGAAKAPAQFRRIEAGGAVSRTVGERPDCDAVSGGCDAECFAVLTGRVTVKAIE